MSVLTVSNEVTSSVQGGRLLKAFLDAQNLLPKVLPQAFKDFQTVEGNGAPGTIHHLTVASGDQTKHLKNRIDAIDTENLTYSYSVIEGDGVPEKLESISHEIKFEAIAEGGCKVKRVSKYNPKPGVEIKEEDFKNDMEEGIAILKVVEAYLVANPQAYA